MEVAARPCSPEMGHALAAQADLCVRLGPGLDLDVLATLRWSAPVSVVPSAAWAIEIRASKYSSVPSRLRLACGATWTATYNDPGGPPRGPTSPSFVSRIWWPSSMPAGIVTRSVRFRSVRPSPLHVSHGVSTILPSPRQRGHALTLTICPSIVWRTLRTSPRPSHCGQVVASVPGAAPVPVHVSHRPSARNSISFSVPLTASSNVMRMSYRRSEPGCGLPRRADPDAAPPKNASKMSLNPPNPSKPAPAGPPSTPARPNVSYRWRRSGSDRIWYASLASLKRAGACGSLLTSGCHCWASLRKARLISASLAPRWTPSTSYRSRSVVAIEREVYERASSLAVVMTASNIAGVSLPVNVFCWLGWYEPISRYAPTSAIGAVTEPRLDGGPAVRRSRPSRGAQRPSRRRRAPAGPARAPAAQLAGQVRRAVVALFRRRLVGRRGAPYGRRDVDVGERQPVVGAPRRRPIGEAGPIQRRPQEVTGRVPGEDPSRPVSAVGRGCQTHQEDPRVRIAKARHRPAPVRLVTKSRDLLARHAFPPFDEARTPPAHDDLGGEGRERGPVGHWRSSLSSRRETRYRPAKPITSRYTTWTSRIGEIAPIVSARMRSTPW